MRTYSIVAMNYLQTESFVAALAVGTAVTLVREPINQFDKNAIAVWVNGQKVGFLPKKQNAALAQFIDQTGQDWQNPDAATMAMDETPNPYPKEIPAIFVRSPNSGYPMVQV